jgi:hypothetical protein
MEDGARERGREREKESERERVRESASSILQNRHLSCEKSKKKI